jgi:hypothetical protein
MRMDEHSDRMKQFTDNVERLAAPERLTEPTILWVETYSKGVREIGEEVGRFVSGHTRRNIDAWIALTQNPTPTKIIETQQRWVTETLREYTEETKRLMDISSGIMRDFMAKVEHPAAE